MKKGGDRPRVSEPGVFLRLVWSAVALSAAALAAVLVGLALGGREFANWLGEAVGEAASGGAVRATFALAGVGVLALDIALVLRALGFGASDVVVFESDPKAGGVAGRIAVDVAALEAALSRCAREDDEVVDAAASVCVARGGLGRPVVCEVQVGLRERADVPGKGKDLSAALRRRFLQIIPIDIDPVMNVTIHIREPLPDAESMKETQEMSVADAAPDAPEPLPDTPDFTGEMHYGESGGEDGKSG